MIKSFTFHRKSKLDLGVLRIAVCALLLMIVSKLPAQQNQITDSIHVDRINAAAEIMNSAGICALITLDKEGIPRVRAMDPFPPTDQLEVWFGSNPNSRKISQIENDPRVSLYYLDKDSTGYVMIHGQAKIIDDPFSKEIYWKEKWNNFYPDYPNGYILIKVVPEWMEIISTRLEILGDPKTWEPPIIKFE